MKIRVIVAAQQIAEYQGPQHLVKPTDDGPLGFEAAYDLNQYDREILASGVQGWGDHTHIVRIHDDDCMIIPADERDNYERHDADYLVQLAAD